MTTNTKRFVQAGFGKPLSSFFSMALAVSLQLSYIGHILLLFLQSTLFSPRHPSLSPESFPNLLFPMSDIVSVTMGTEGASSWQILNQ